MFATCLTNSLLVFLVKLLFIHVGSFPDVTIVTIKIIPRLYKTGIYFLETICEHLGNMLIVKTHQVKYCPQGL